MPIAERWPSGNWLHLYIEPDPTALAPMYTAYREVIDRFPALTPVEPQWLHLTIAMITHRPAEDIGEPERDALVQALRDRLAFIQQFTAWLGPAMAGTGGVLLDTSSATDAHMQRLTNATSATMDLVLSHPPQRHIPLPAHIALAYATQPCDSGPITAALRRVRLDRVPLPVHSLALVNVRYHHTPPRLTWDTLATIPLGTNPPTATSHRQSIGVEREFWRDVVDTAAIDRLADQGRAMLCRDLFGLPEQQYWHLLSTKARKASSPNCCAAGHSPNAPPTHPPNNPAPEPTPHDPLTDHGCSPLSEP